MSDLPDSSVDKLDAPACPLPQPVYFHEHRWIRHGFGTGTSESTTLWGPLSCWCGAICG